MDPLSFIKQKLSQGLSTVENWGSQAGNDVSGAVGNLFGTNATPQRNAPTPPPQFRATPPSNTPGQLPTALQIQDSTPNQQLPKPIQIQQTQQPNPTPLPNLAKPNTAVAPIKIVQPNAPKFQPQILNNQGTPIRPPRGNAAVDEGLSSLVRGAVGFPATIIKGAIVDPAREAMAQATHNPTAYKNASDDAIKDNLFAPFVPAGNLLATSMRQKPNEQAAEQSGKNAEQTILTVLINKYGDSPDVRRIAHEFGQNAQLSMENQNANDITQALAGFNLTPNSGARQILQAALLSGVSAAGTASLPDMVELLRTPNLGGMSAEDLVAPASRNTSLSNAINEGLRPGETRTLPPTPEAPQSGPPSASPPVVLQPSGEDSLAPTPTAATEVSPQAQGRMPTELDSHETYGNNTTEPTEVNTGDTFPRRNADAERAAIAEMETSGDLSRAVKAYSSIAGTDELTSHGAVVGALHDRGLIPKGEGDVTALTKPLKVPKNLPTDVSDAAKALDEAYRERVSAKDVGELVGSARGRMERFKVLAADLQKSIERNFTPEEQIAIRDNLEGAATPEEVTPKVRAATDVFKQLNEKAYNIRDLARPEELGRVKQYATRIRSRGRSTGNAIKINDIKDLFSTDTRFSESRTVHKYVAADGEIRYGTIKDAGLRRNKEGDLVSGKKVFVPRAVSTRELNENGFNYVNKYAPIAKAYHSDTGAVKARYDALQQLLNNQDKFQIRDAADALPGDAQINHIPELNGKYAPRKVADELQNTFKAADRRTPYGRAWDALQNGVIGQIVLNPVFHTKNLAELTGEASGMIPLRAGSDLPSGPFGVAKVTAEAARLVSSPEYAHDMLLDYLKYDRLPDYGAHHETVLTKAADIAGIPHLSKLSSATMEQIDTSFRLSLYGAFRRAGVEGGDAVKIINQFLGDTHNVGLMARTFGMFWNYFKTQLRAGPGLLLHPVRNAGAAINLAVIYATWYGLNRALQDWTGNKHASIGNPGSLGIIKQATDIPSEVRSGNLGPSVVNHISPLLVEGGNQLYGGDLYTGQRFTSGKDRINNLVSTLLPASQYATKVANGKSSTGQQVLNIATGITLPHTTGAPAIPNTNNPLASAINLPGAKVATGGDATGIDQATAYYDAKNKMMSSIAGDSTATAIVNDYMAKDKNSDGQTVLNNSYQQAQNDGNLLKSDAALKAVQQFQQSQPDHNPMWDLPLDKLKVYLSYKAMIPGDPNQTVAEQHNPWLTDQFAKEVAWGSKLQLSGNVVQGPGYVPYPTLSPSQQGMISQVSKLSANQNRTPNQEKQLQDLEANPSLQAAFGLLNKYTNDRRALWPGVQPIPFPSGNLNPQQEQMLQYESGLPKGARSAFIRANQDSWNQIQQVLAENTIYNVERYGGIIQQGGTEPNFLKDVYNAGKYDIAPVQQSDGSTSYQVNPGLAYQLEKSASGSTFKPLVPLPKRPKRHTTKISRLKVRKVRTIRVHKNGPVKIHKAQTLRPVHIGHGGPLKIRTK